MSVAVVDLDEMIQESRDAREVKRALSVKLFLQSMPVVEICALLQVSQPFVSKWHGIYQVQGASGLSLGYAGTQGYLEPEQTSAVIAWLQAQAAPSGSGLRDYVEARYGVVYQSPQSYYELMHAAGLSYHKRRKSIPSVMRSKCNSSVKRLKKLAQHWQEIEQGEMVVLLEDECHLLWGDVCGDAWGVRGEPMEVPMTNQKQRQTYYGALNFLTRQWHLKAFAAGNSQHTVAYVQWLQEQYPGKKLLLLWDGATYHRDGAMKEFLAEVNVGLAEADWRITLMSFAPNAPQQNPVEDVWLAAKNHLRRHFWQNKTFAQVKQAFCSFLQDFSLQSVKFDWYQPEQRLLQLI